MEQWQVKRTDGVCAQHDEPLEPGQEYMAALIDCGDHFERKDFCLDCWAAYEPEVFSFWKTSIPMPNEKKKLFVDDGVLINFFERLADEEEPLKIHFRFVLALILMRKRLLKYEDSFKKDDGTEIWSMRFVRQQNTP